ncbi:hypothetical protein PN498_06575, partial [Oscillatoria sp. CS-180]|uniref:hypothetical protein n=1 Tax=Oscillatoria sp. CS-180 TaxID=3021720 RepID=UPI002330EA2B
SVVRRQKVLNGNHWGFLQESCWVGIPEDSVALRRSASVGRPKIGKARTTDCSCLWVRRWFVLRPLASAADQMFGEASCTDAAMVADDNSFDPPEQPYCSTELVGKG